MCLLILQKKDTKIKDNSLRNAYESNPDGVGYSFVSINKMVTKKFRSYDKFLKEYKADISMYSSKSPFLLHFRMTTHGTNKGTFNVHPFEVRSGLMFAHNGIISEVDNHKKLSDTQVFNKEYLQKLSKDFLKNKATIKLIENFIGTSKLAFLDSKGNYKILNEEFGHWKDNVWYSNSSYESRGHSCYGYGWSMDYIDSADDDYTMYRATSVKAKYPYKNSHIPNLKCEWCDDRVNSLKQVDISDKYEDEKPSYLWMCSTCVEYEESPEQMEIERYNNSFKVDKNDTKLLTIGKV